MRALAAGLLALCAAAFPAIAQTVRADPYLVIIESALDFDEQDVRVASEARRGEALISMGVSHRRTGVLQNDLRRDRALVSVLRGGLPGFYAGSFSQPNGQPRDMWCFARNAENLAAGTRCIIHQGNRPDGSQIWREAGDPDNPYLPMTAGVNLAAPPIPAPEITEQPVDIHPDLRVEYVFRRWGDDHLDVQLQLGGRPMLATGVFRRVPVEADGSALIATQFGVLRVERGASGRARVTLIELVAPAAN